MAKTVKLYEAYTVDEDGNKFVTGYAYGEPWVSQALLMDDIKFDTPEEAEKWWNENYA